MKALYGLVVFGLAISTSQVNAKLNNIATTLLDKPAMFANKNRLKVTSAQQAAQKVTSRYGGKVLKVRKKKVNGGPGYKVKLLKDNGQIISVTVDATSGRVKGK